MAELQAVDDERGGVLVVGADGERGVLCRAQAATVLVPPEGDGQVSLENLKFQDGSRGEIQNETPEKVPLGLGNHRKYLPLKCK